MRLEDKRSPFQSYSLNWGRNDSVMTVVVLLMTSHDCTLAIAVPSVKSVTQDFRNSKAINDCKIF